MCVCISHTCLTLNNRFQTKMGCWGGAATKPKCQTWLYQSRWQTSGEAGRQGAGTRAETHVARVVPLSVAAHLMVLRGRRLARCRVDAVMLLAYRSPPSAKAGTCQRLGTETLGAQGSAQPESCLAAWTSGEGFCDGCRIRCRARTSRKKTTPPPRTRSSPCWRSLRRTVASSACS